MKKKKRNNNTYFSKEKEILNSLDKNYFHICTEVTENNDLRWSVYFKNLPKKVYFSRNNTALLSSEKNKIEDVYQLKCQFEKEKNKVVRSNRYELMNITTIIFNQINIMQGYFRRAVHALVMLFSAADLIILFFTHSVDFSFLLLALMIIMAIAIIIQENKICKQTKKSLLQARENYIKEKIKRQGLYFVERLKMTYKEAIEKNIKEGYIGENFTCNGRCSKCGNCCGSVLPIDQEDADKIQEYVIKNRIFPQRHLLVMQNKLQCPYYTGNKENGCAIYEARPKICKYYKCDNKGWNVEELKTMKNAFLVDMWSFAIAIEKEMKKHGINQETRKKANKSI